MHFANRIGWFLFALAMSIRPAGADPDIVVIASSESGIENLTRTEVADIFLGKVSRFPGGAIAVPLDQPEGSAAREEFYRSFAGRSAAQVKAHWSRIIFTGRGLPPTVVQDNREALERVAQNPNAIAYVERSLVDGRVRIVAF